MSASIFTSGKEDSQAGSPEAAQRAPGRLRKAAARVSKEVSADGVRLVSGGPGDHPSILQMLRSVLQAPSLGEFHASQEDPFYEPSDRLLIKQGSQIVSHVHLTRRTMCFGALRLPMMGLHWLATLPELRGRGYATRLLEMADRQMILDGTILGTLRTNSPRFFQRAGWTSCGRYACSRASARDLLSQLSTRKPTTLFHQEPRFNIRFWRQVELPALMRIYVQNTGGRTGPLERSEAYWRWLIRRKAFDHINVVIEGPDRIDRDQGVSRIVGYAVTKQERLVELMTLPSHPMAASELLARACGDAIERDHHTIFLHAPPDDPLHEMLVASGGSQRAGESAYSEAFMVKLLDPLRFLQMLCPVFHDRALSDDLSLPVELGLLVEGQKYLVNVEKQAATVLPDKLSRSYLICTRGQLTQLLMGQVDLDQAMAEGRLQSSTQTAHQSARVLFPRLPLWWPIFDDLPA